MKKAIKDALVQEGSLLIEAHRLPHFVALVEEAHYCKAAQRLGMDQPTLSRSIMRLENVRRRAATSAHGTLGHADAGG